MSDWDKIQSYGYTEMEKYHIGAKIKLRMFGGKFTGEIIDHLPPQGLLAPRYKCLLSNGEETGFLLRSDLILL